MRTDVSAPVLAIIHTNGLTRQSLHRNKFSASNRISTLVLYGSCVVAGNFVNALIGDKIAVGLEVHLAVDTHDFRVVPGEKQTNLIFDVLLPNDYKDGQKLNEKLTAYAASLDPRYHLVVRYDTTFV